jgi:glucose/mannose transport system substrate-binding protein
MLSPAVQVSFNSAKGSLPVRPDVDLTTVNECTQKGLDLLAAGSTVPAGTQLLSPDTVTQLNDLMTEFWSTPSMTVAEVQQQYSDIIADAD